MAEGISTIKRKKDHNGASTAEGQKLWKAMSIHVLKGHGI